MEQPVTAAWVGRTPTCLALWPSCRTGGLAAAKPRQYFYSPDIFMHNNYLNKTDPEALGRCSESFWSFGKNAPNEQS